MKKINNITILICIIILVCIIGILLINNKNIKSGSLEQITYKEIEKKLENKDTFILVMSQSTCSHCASYKPKLKEIAKNYNITIYYLNYDLENENIQKNILSTLNFDGATPTTLFFKEGKEISKMKRISGDISEDKIIKTLKELEYINE